MLHILIFMVIIKQTVNECITAKLIKMKQWNNKDNPKKINKKQNK